MRIVEEVYQVILHQNSWRESQWEMILFAESYLRIVPWRDCEHTLRTKIYTIQLIDFNLH